MDDNLFYNSINDYIKNILGRLERINECELNIISQFYTFDEFNVLFKDIINPEDYSNIMLDYKLDIKILNQKLINIKEEVVNYKKNIDIYWDRYNKNYKNHLNMKLSFIFNELKKNEFGIYRVDKPQLLLNKALDFYKTIININTDKDLLESFAFSDKNYVIFGKNGSGKTRLLNYVKFNYFKSNSFVIPSDREIKFGKLSNIDMNYSENFTLDKLFTSDYTLPNDILTLKIKDKEFDDLHDGKFVTTVESQIIGETYNKLKTIFESLGLERKIFLDSNSNKFMLYNDDLNIKPYYIKDGSDGEKSIFLFITYILLCPLNSFVFIDEPEKHFNTALLNELFTQLEREREDIVFIYCTHNVDFIELRTNVKLIYLEKYDGKNWNIKEIDSFEEISMDVFINIVGTKKQVLFIESEKDKLDYKFYSNLFSKYKVIPVSSCDKVINNCKLLNSEKYLNLNRKFFGIIDNDFRNKSEIEKYKESNIFILPYNEIENLLMSSVILDYVCTKYSLQDKIEKFKNAVIEMAIKDKNGIIQDYINKVYYRIIEKEHLQYNGMIEEFDNEILEMNKNNQTKFNDILKTFIEDLEKSLDSRDYDSIIKCYPNKGFLSCLNVLDVKYQRYIIWIEGLLNTDLEFKKVIKEKIFENYFE